MKKTITLISLLLVISVAITACSQSGTISPEMGQSVKNTVAVLQTQTAVGPTSTPLPSATSTANPLATFTSIPTLAPSITPAGTQTPVFLISKWVDDNYSVNTKVKARETFTKTWTLTNGGTATWKKDYKIVQVSGESMGAESTPLNAVVSPGGSVQVTMTLTAPASLGTHRANFMLEAADGVTTFGYGDNGNLPFYVQIDVESYFAVSSVNINAKVPSGAACPAEIKLNADITANGSGDVTYYFVTSQGTSDTYTLKFSGKGTLTTDTIKFTVTSPDDLTVDLYIDNPNHQKFNGITVSSPCTP